jgi:acetylornithine deacetylase/succinyl-diaminopimelate desuccinylase-like protein
MVDDEELIEFASIAGPTGAERARIGWLRARLEGFPGERVVDATGNLLWRFGPDRPRLLVMAHLDTVFGDGIALEIRREAGQLVGPGVGDNAAAVLAVVWAVEQMDDVPAGLAIAFTVGEEGLGNLRGARAACTSLEPEAVIALEGHGLDEVIVDHVGSVRARVTVTGPGGHSWWDRGTPSASHAIVELATELVALDANIGVISGGDSVNAIAARAELLAERRSLVESELDDFAMALDGLRVDPPLQLEVEPVGRRPAGRTDPDSGLVSAVRGLRMGLGLPDRLGSGSTDANAAIAAGIPAVALGCARGSGMHSLDERIDLRSLEFGCVQVLEVMRALGR